MTFYKVNSSSRDTHKGWRQASIAEIGIKIDNSKYEGEKFASLLDWAASRFETVLITLSDTLYRHNYEAEGHAKDVAVNMARTYGDFWLARNKAAIRKYSGKADIIVQRWDDWKSHPQFPEVLKDLQSLYRHDEGFYKSVRADIDGFLSRYGKKITPENKFLYNRKSYDYVLEEAAVYILIGREIGSARLYPGTDLQSFQYMRQPDTPAHLKGLENCPHVRLSFHRKPAFSAEVHDDNRDAA